MWCIGHGLQVADPTGPAHRHGRRPIDLSDAGDAVPATGAPAAHAELRGGYEEAHQEVAGALIPKAFQIPSLYIRYIYI